MSERLHGDDDLMDTYPGGRRFPGPKLEALRDDAVSCPCRAGDRAHEVMIVFRGGASTTHARVPAASAHELVEAVAKGRGTVWWRAFGTGEGTVGGVTMLHASTIAMVSLTATTTLTGEAIGR